jgi:hypothetical protein
MYLQDSHFSNPIFYHVDVGSPLYSTHLAFIHVSSIGPIATGLFSSANLETAFLVLQITATRVIVEKHLLS